jgi:hypothetical protein
MFYEPGTATERALEMVYGLLELPPAFAPAPLVAPPRPAVRLR